LKPPRKTAVGTSRYGWGGLWLIWWTHIWPKGGWWHDSRSPSENGQQQPNEWKTARTEVKPAKQGRYSDVPILSVKKRSLKST